MLTWLEYKEMFRKSIPNASRPEIRKYYNKYYETELKMLSIKDLPDFKPFELAPLECKTNTPTRKWGYSIPKKKKEEIPMNYASAAIVATADTSDKDQRRYLSCRVEDVYYEKKEALRGQFNIDPYTPKSAEELQDMIKNGEFEIKGLGDKDKGRYFYWTDALRFQKAPADKDGYEAAKIELKKFRQDQLDIITVKSLDDGFNALKAMEAWTPSSK